MNAADPNQPADPATSNLPLPNGCILVPGGRVRMTRAQAMSIPESTADALGLVLDDDAASPDSEVVVWPEKDSTDENGAPVDDVVRTLVHPANPGATPLPAALDLFAEVEPSVRTTGGI